MIKHKFWNDKDYWEKNFIRNDLTFDNKKAMIFFGCQGTATRNQLVKLNILYIKGKSNNHLLNKEFWNDKDYWEKNFIRNDLTFDNKKAMIFFGTGNGILNQIKKLNIIYKIQKNNNHLLNKEFWNDKDYWEKNFLNNDLYFDYISAKNFFGCKTKAVYNKINNLNIIYNKFEKTSLCELTLLTYITTLLPKQTILKNNKKIIKINNRFKELDIYLPELQLAIEYNGSYWHSTKDKYYHQQKSIACLEQGIRLLHLYGHQQNQYELIDKFLINNYDSKTTIFNLDNGCYPLDEKFEILEPELFESNGFLLWNAGHIKIASEL